MAAPVRTPAEMANHLAMLQMDLADPEFRRHAVAHGRALRREAERLLAAAIERRLADGDPATLAGAVQIAFNGALVTWAIHAEGTLERHVRRVLPIVLGHVPQRSAGRRVRRTSAPSDG